MASFLSLSMMFSTMKKFSQAAEAQLVLFLQTYFHGEILLFNDLSFTSTKKITF